MNYMLTLLAYLVVGTVISLICRKGWSVKTFGDWAQFILLWPVFAVMMIGFGVFEIGYRTRIWRDNSLS